MKASAGRESGDGVMVVCICGGRDGGRGGVGWGVWIGRTKRKTKQEGKKNKISFLVLESCHFEKRRTLRSDGDIMVGDCCVLVFSACSLTHRVLGQPLWF